jgi:glutamate dehydrogenase (NAD(P)+)
MANEQHVVIQGYGKVGAPLVKLLSDRGMKVVGIADVKGAIHVPGGINHITMSEHYAEAGTIVGYPGSDDVPPEQLFTIPSDIAIPAALGGSIDEKVAVNNGGLHRR